MDIDNHCLELPEDFPQFPNKVEFIQELSELLLSYGLPLDGDVSSSPPGPAQMRGTGTEALRNLVDDGRNGNLPLDVADLLQGNPTLERLQALAKRTGVKVARLEELVAGQKSLGEENTGVARTGIEEEELRNAKLNVQLREVFAARFVAMFADYEAFVIQNSPDLESWLSNREQMHNFDKVTKEHTKYSHVSVYNRALTSQTVVYAFSPLSRPPSCLTSPSRTCLFCVASSRPRCSPPSSTIKSCPSGRKRSPCCASLTDASRRPASTACALPACDPPSTRGAPSSTSPVSGYTSLNSYMAECV